MRNICRGVRDTTDEEVVAWFVGHVRNVIESDVHGWPWPAFEWVFLVPPAQEMEAEKDESEDEDMEDDGADDRPIYNPLNLPLGWDGKPIPFWLYKLHGMGIEYKCEICGNYSYWGRRAFERHFQEWRHAFGMRCLKIPNTAHFKEITKIEEAITLYEKLKRDAEEQTFRPEQATCGHLRSGSTDGG
ncbi:Splicing factor SF3a60 homolog (Protein ATROPOS) (Splicing factor ATO) [Durusdinium trenchii]|uniref:Splicing factor SF3a60 homolog (Protein ATROPOS) (Splicing factor ATO) n=1 Tax=Durusdinium trenchii TaxID=1381693 RepID=A0ABP0K1X2_9DINO